MSIPTNPAEPDPTPRVWWKTGDEGEFLMTPHFEGMEETLRADGWLPTYDTAGVGHQPSFEQVLAGIGKPREGAQAKPAEAAGVLAREAAIGRESLRLARKLESAPTDAEIIEKVGSDAIAWLPISEDEEVVGFVRWILATFGAQPAEVPALTDRDAWFADLMDLLAWSSKDEGEDGDEALARVRELIKERRDRLAALAPQLALKEGPET